ncbi:unnamed protein product, partial [Prorocentrum cordatum]
APKEGVAHKLNETFAVKFESAAYAKATARSSIPQKFPFLCRRNIIIGRVWQAVSNHFASKGIGQGIVLRVNGHKGILFFTKNEEVTVLCALAENPDASASIKSEFAAFQTLQMSKKQ